jgi:hypothetical protein
MQALPSASVMVDWADQAGLMNTKNKNTKIKKRDAMALPPQ